MLAFDLLRMGFAHRVLCGIAIALVGTPAIGVKAGDAKRFEQSFALEKHLIFWLSGILRSEKLLYYQILISTYRRSNILRSESSGAPDL
jgi:hypothetical protein